MIALLALASGCGGGSTDRTHIDGLQVVTIVGEPAAAALGEAVLLDVVVANPEGVGADVLQWSCLLFEGRCLEARAVALSEWASVSTLGGTHAVFLRNVPSEVDEVLAAAEAELGQVPSYLDLRVNALACQAGLCPIIDEVRAIDATGGPAPPDLGADLADPQRWLPDLPMDGTSLATRSFRVFLSPPAHRNRNPSAEARFPGANEDVLMASRDDWLELAFWVEDPDLESVYVYPQTTVGRFDDNKVKAEDGVVRLYLLGEEAGATGRVFVVSDDRDGGLSVWERDVVVK